jgi:hypothetical protein
MALWHGDTDPSQTRLTLFSWASRLGHSPHLQSPNRVRLEEAFRDLRAVVRQRESVLRHRHFANRGYVAARTFDLQRSLPTKYEAGQPQSSVLSLEVVTTNARGCTASR